MVQCVRKGPQELCPGWRSGGGCFSSALALARYLNRDLATSRTVAAASPARGAARVAARLEATAPRERESPGPAVEDPGEVRAGADRSAATRRRNSCGCLAGATLTSPHTGFVISACKVGVRPFAGQVTLGFRSWTILGGVGKHTSCRNGRGAPRPPRLRRGCRAREWTLMPAITNPPPEALRALRGTIPRELRELCTPPPGRGWSRRNRDEREVLDGRSEVYG
jgi:hypothetical protein